MALIGYARVSSVGQSLDVQRDKLKHCDKLFEEKHSGTSDRRPRLAACLDYVREGDTLVVTRLDRLARSTFHLCQIAEILQRKGVQLQVLDQQIHTADATGRLLFNMLGAIAQFETEIRAERQMDGILKAKAQGVPLGRRKTLTSAQVADLHARRQEGATIRTLMREFKISKATVYRYLGAAAQVDVRDSGPVDQVAVAVPPMPITTPVEQPTHEPTPPSTPEPTDGQAWRETVQPVRISGAKKVHLMLPDEGAMTTLCGRALGTDALPVAFFQYDDCARCRQRASSLGRVCVRCGEPLILQGAPGLCRACTLERQSASDRVIL